MYYSPQLEGVRLKLFRAKDHFLDLDVAIGAFFAEQSKSAGHKFENETELVITWPENPPLDPRFALITGDCVHSIRSALDHLVAQLAISNNAPAIAIEKTAFPVCLSAEDFKNATVRKVAPYISGDAFTEIRKLQPYSTGDGKNDILWVLSQLDIIDKHRLLIVAKHKMRPRSFSLITDTGNHFAHSYGMDNPWKSSENGAEIVRFRLLGLPAHTKVNVQVSAEGTVQIEQTGLICDGHNLLMVLRDLINYVGGIVDYFGKRFFGEGRTPACDISREA